MARKSMSHLNLPDDHPALQPTLVACVSCATEITLLESWQAVVLLKRGGSRVVKPLCEACYRQYPQPPPEKRQ